MKEELEFEVVTSKGETKTIKESQISELTRTEGSSFVRTITGEYYSVSKETGDRIFERMVITQ